MDIITKISLALILLGAIGGLMLSVSQILSAKKSEKLIIETLKDENSELKNQTQLLKDDIKDLKTSNSTLNTDLRESTDLINEKNEKIEKLNEEILNKSNFIQNTLFGDGFCYANIDYLTPNGKSVNLYLRYDNENKFPIYNFKTFVYRYDELSKLFYDVDGKKHIKFNEMSKAELFEFERAEISPESSEIINKYEIPYQTTQKYLIQLFQRNGVYLEKLVFLIKESEIFWGIQVFKDGNLVKEVYNINVEDKAKLISDLASISIEPILMGE